MLDMMYPVTEDDSVIRKARVSRLKDSFFYCLNQPDVKNFKGTKYGVMMAATDFADHSEPFRKTKNFESNRMFAVINGHEFVDKIYKYVTAA